MWEMRLQITELNHKDELSSLSEEEVRERENLISEYVKWSAKPEFLLYQKTRAKWLQEDTQTLGSTTMWSIGRGVVILLKSYLLMLGEHKSQMR